MLDLCQSCNNWFAQNQIEDFTKNSIFFKNGTPFHVLWFICWNSGHPYPKSDCQRVQVWIQHPKFTNRVCYIKSLNVSLCRKRDAEWCIGTFARGGIPNMPVACIIQYCGTHKLTHPEQTTMRQSMLSLVLFVCTPRGGPRSQELPLHYVQQLCGCPTATE